MKKEKYLISQGEIDEITKTLNIEYIGNSRIDGSPYFKVKKEIFEIYNMTDYFDIEYVPLLGDQMPNFPAGEKDHLIFKIFKIKERFYKLIRKEKLLKIDLAV